MCSYFGWRLNDGQAFGGDGAGLFDVLRPIHDVRVVETRRRHPGTHGSHTALTRGERFEGAGIVLSWSGKAVSDQHVRGEDAPLVLGLAELGNVVTDRIRGDIHRNGEHSVEL